MPLVAVPLVVLLAGLVLLALALTAKVWAEAMLHVFAAGHGGGILRIITLPVRLLERVVMPGLNFVVHELTKAASHYMHPIAHWLDGLAAFVAAEAAAGEHFALEVAHGFERTVGHVIPREIGQATRPIRRDVKRATAIGLGAAAALARYRHGIDRLLRDRVLPGLRRLERATTVTIPRELGRIRARARTLERDLRHPSTATLRALARRLWLVGLAGLMIRTLARRFPWLFCRKVKKVGGRVCGVNQDLLDALLFETLLLTGTINLDTLVRQAQAVAKLAEEGLSELIDGFE